MYNRYIPQSDGSFQRSSVPDSIPRTPVIEPQPVQEQQRSPASQQPCKATPEVQRCSRKHCQHQHAQRPCGEEKHSVGLSSFWKQILPADFDTGELIVVLLLLLMSSDCKEDQNTALLTLVLYLLL